MKRFLGYAVQTLIAAVIIGGAVYFYMQAKPEQNTKKKMAREAYVKVESFQTQKQIDRLEALGTALSNQEVDITATVTEKVVSIHFEDGQRVKKGDLLVQLKNDEVLAEEKQLKATLAECQRELDRLGKLLDTNAIARKEYDMQLTKKLLAEAAIEGVEAKLHDRRITAPFTGTLGIRQIEVGSLVSAGTVIAPLDDISSVKVDFAVPEKYVSRIRPGMAIRVSGDALGNDEFTGVISAVATRIDPISRSLTVRGIIANPEERLQSGMLLQVVLLFGERDALLIPEKAISNLGERQFVFHVDANNIARRQEVTTGIRRNGMVEILSGCNPGDQIVTEGIAKVVDGMKVIRQQEK